MTDPGFAPAKVNLFLHVGPPEPDGYHPICSLVAFADVGDRVSIGLAEAPGFVVQGPFAADLDGDDNLILRAVRALEAEVGEPFPPLHASLRKDLPVAAGLGGGSSDGAAVLRLLAPAFDLDLDDREVVAAASALGADGPMCLRAEPVIAEGRGERLSPAPQLPEVHAVLANPGVLSPTGPVYRAYDAAPHPFGADRPALPESFESGEELAAVLAGTRNDLEAPAVRLNPRIGDALRDLGGRDETLLARMSGSGATVFALCAGEIEAAGLAERLALEHPDWWVRPCRLGAPLRTA